MMTVNWSSAQQMLTYQDEPEPRYRDSAGGDGGVGGGPAAATEFDISRMDSTQNWYVYYEMFKFRIAPKYLDCN